jgi:predicted ATPase
LLRGRCRMNRPRTAGRAGGFVQHVQFDLNGDPGSYPLILPVVRHLAGTGGLELAPGVTFLVGDNGYR